MNYFIYRLYSSDDKLLYVGVTSDTSARFRHHRAYSAWYKFVTRHDVRKLDGCYLKEEILGLEKEAIKNEKPLYNVIHNLRNGPKLTKAFLLRLTDDDYKKIENASYTLRIKKCDFVRIAVSDKYEELKKSQDLLTKGSR